MFEPGLIASQFLAGLSTGTLFGMMAIGLSLIFGLLGVVNFAHYAFFALGAYLTLIVMQTLGVPFWPALAAATAITAGIGAGIERSLVRRLYGYDPATTLIFTFGIGLIIIEIIRITQGVDYKPFSVPPELTGAVTFFGYQFAHYRIFYIAIGAVLFYLVYMLLTRTSLGLQIRAGTQDRDMTRALGIDINRVFTITFALGVGLAALGAGLSSPIMGVFPEMGIEILIIAFAVIVIGGMGSFLGTMVAAYLCGLISSFVTLVSPQMSTIAIFIFMAVMILVRPGGLFGEATERER